MDVQPAQEEHREDPDSETKEGEGIEECSRAGAKEEPESKAEREPEASQKPIRRHRDMHCKVSLLDDTVFECVVEVSAFESQSQSLQSLHVGCGAAKDKTHSQDHSVDGNEVVGKLSVLFFPP